MSGPQDPEEPSMTSDRTPAEALARARWDRELDPDHPWHVAWDDVSPRLRQEQVEFAEADIELLDAAGFRVTPEPDSAADRPDHCPTCGSNDRSKRLAGCRSAPWEPWELDVDPWHFNLPGYSTAPVDAHPDLDLADRPTDVLAELHLTDPCPECGSRGACGYDEQGRPMIHTTQGDDDATL